MAPLLGFKDELHIKDNIFTVLLDFFVIYQVFFLLASLSITFMLFCSILTTFTTKYRKKFRLFCFHDLATHLKIFWLQP